MTTNIVLRIEPVYLPTIEARVVENLLNIAIAVRKPKHGHTKIGLKI